MRVKLPSLTSGLEETRSEATEGVDNPLTAHPYSVLDKTKIQETFGLDIPYWTDSLRQCIANLMKTENGKRETENCE